MFENRKKVFAEYERLINQLRILRNDLDEQTIVTEAQNIASQNPIRLSTVILECIGLAEENKKMPWE